MYPPIQVRNPVYRLKLARMGLGGMSAEMVSGILQRVLLQPKPGNVAYLGVRWGLQSMLNGEPGFGCCWAHMTF